MAKKIKITLVICLLLAIGIGGRYAYFKQPLANSPLRLHVIANSDTLYDQEVKLLIRDKTIEILRPLIAGAATKQEAAAVIEDNIALLELSCNEVLNSYAAYGLKAGLEVASFPEKSYGDMVLPAGNYDTLRLVLGAGEGKNW